MSLSIELQAAQEEALQRISDVLEEVQQQLALAQKAMMDKFFTDPSFDPAPVFTVGADSPFAMGVLYSHQAVLRTVGRDAELQDLIKLATSFREWQERHGMTDMCGSCGNVHKSPFKNICG